MTGFPAEHFGLTDRGILAEGKLAWSYLTVQDLDEAEATREHVDGLINYARNIEGVQVGVLFNATGADVTKVSLRSVDAFNSADFLSEYGGGGHAAAAGATIEKPLDAVRSEIIGRLERALGEEQ